MSGFPFGTPQSSSNTNNFASFGQGAFGSPPASAAPSGNFGFSPSNNAFASNTGGFGGSSGFGSAPSTSPFGTSGAGGGFGSSTTSGFGGGNSGFGTGGGGGFDTASQTSAPSGFGGFPTGAFGSSSNNNTAASSGFGNSPFGGGASNNFANFSSNNSGFGSDGNTFNSDPFGASNTPASNTGGSTTSFGQPFGKDPFASSSMDADNPFEASNAPAAAPISFGSSSNVIVPNTANTPQSGFSGNVFPTSFASGGFTPSSSNNNNNSNMGMSSDNEDMTESANLSPHGSPKRSSMSDAGISMSPIPEDDQQANNNNKTQEETMAEKKARLERRIAEKKKKLEEHKRRKEAAARAKESSRSPTPDNSASLNASATPFVPSSTRSRDAGDESVAFSQASSSLAERNAVRFSMASTATNLKSQLPSDLRDRGDRDIVSANKDLGAASDREHLDSAVALVGKCPHMCPDDELLRREREGDIQFLEIPKPGDLHPSNWTLRDTAVKRFRRSAADYKLDVPEWVRPPDVLEQVCAYLEEWVMDRDRQGADPRFSQPDGPPPLDVYQFIWDRTRMVRKDFILQNYVGTGGKCDARAVRCHERIARWHAMCEHQLSHIDDYVVMQSQQNIQELGQTMKTLNQYYDDSLKRSLVEVPDEFGNETRPDLTGFSHGCRNDIVQGKNPVDYDGSPLNNSPTSPGPTRLMGANFVGSPSHGTAEPEMRGIYILLTMNNDGGMEVLKYAARLFRERPEVYQSEPVQLALTIFKVKKEYNYARFFEILRSPKTPYLFACMMFKHVELMRKAAFRIMSRSYGARRKDTGEAIYDAYPLKRLVNLLCFESIDEAREACRHYNITVKEMKMRSSSSSQSEIAEIVFWRGSDFKEPTHPEKGVTIPLRPWKMIRTIERKLNGATRLAVCRGEVSGPGSSLAGTVSPEIALRQKEEAEKRRKERQEAEARAAALRAKAEEAERLKEEEETRMREREARRLAAEQERKEKELREVEEFKLRQKLEEERRLKEAEERRLREAAEAEKKRREANERAMLELRLKEEEERRIAAEKEAARKQAELEEKERMLQRERQEALRLLAEEKERQRIREEEEKLRRAEEERRVREEEEARIEKQRRQQEEIKRKLEEERRVALEWEKKINTARKELIWRRWRQKLARSLQMTEFTKSCLARVDPTFASGLSEVGESFQVAMAEASNTDAISWETASSRPVNTRRILERLLCDFPIRIDLSAMTTEELGKDAHRSTIARARNGAFDGQTRAVVLFKVAVILPGARNMIEESTAELVKSWINSRIEYERISESHVSVDDGETIEVRVVTVDGNDKSKSCDCHAALFLVPPPWSESELSDGLVESFSSMSALIDETVPRVVLLFNDDLSSSAIESRSEFVVQHLSGSSGDLSVVSPPSLSEEAFDDSLVAACNGLVEAFVSDPSNLRQMVNRLPISRLGTMCICDSLWNGDQLDSFNEGDSIAECAREALLAMVTVLDEMGLENGEAWSTWPPSEFFDEGSLQNYFGMGKDLPASWSSTLLRSSVQPAIMEFYGMLQGTLRDIVDRLLDQAPQDLRKYSDIMFEKKQYRRCLQRALMWREETGKLVACQQWVFLPNGVVEVLMKRMFEKRKQAHATVSQSSSSGVDSLASSRYGVDEMTTFSTSNSSAETDQVPQRLGTDQKRDFLQPESMEEPDPESENARMTLCTGVSNAYSLWASYKPNNILGELHGSLNSTDTSSNKRKSIDSNASDKPPVSKAYSLLTSCAPTKRHRSRSPSRTSRDIEDSRSFSASLDSILSGNLVKDMKIGSTTLSSLLQGVKCIQPDLDAQTK